MEVILKHKYYGLFLLLFIMCALASPKVNAATPKNTISIHKTVKVNKSFKVTNILKLKNTHIKEYSFSTTNPKVISVSSKGKVKGLKKGRAVITVTSKTDNSVFAKIKVSVKNRYTKGQLRLMSSIIYSEASSESYAGKKAVGIVIMNRIRSREFPNTLSGVIYQPGQFGPARNGSLAKSLALYGSGRMSKDCIKAAKATLNGDISVSYNKTVYNMRSYLFFSGYVSGCRLQIGNHQFK